MFSVRSFIVLFPLLFSVSFIFGQNYSLEAIKSAPFPSELVSARVGSKIAWAMDEKGLRNIYVAEGPDFKPRKLTNYSEDDGQEITSISITNNGKWVVFVRGGDHGSNFEGQRPVNPAGKTNPSPVQVWQIPFQGGAMRFISEGDEPAISPINDVVVFIKDGQPWVSKLDTVMNDEFLEIPVPILKTRGTVSQVKWSPDGSKLAFVANRGDHSFIGWLPYGSNQIAWLDPSFSKDTSPRWSPDGKSIAFIRTPATGGATDSLTLRKRIEWSIRTVALSGESSKIIWSAPKNYRGSFRLPMAGLIYFGRKMTELYLRRIRMDGLICIRFLHPGGMHFC